MDCSHFQLGVVFSKRGLVGWLLISLRNTSKWQSLGNLLPNPISPVHQGTSHVFPKQNKMQNNKYLFNPRCLLELNWVLSPGNMRSWNAWGQQKRNSTRKISQLATSSFISWLQNREILKSVKQAVLGLLLPPSVHTSTTLTVPFFQTLRCPHLNNGSYRFLGTCYESSPDLINS